MTMTYAEMSARLLRDAASFFKTIAKDNQSIAGQMYENAEVFEQVAFYVEKDPLGSPKPVGDNENDSEEGKQQGGEQETSEASEGK